MDKELLKGAELYPAKNIPPLSPEIVARFLSSIQIASGHAYMIADALGWHEEPREKKLESIALMHEELSEVSKAVREHSPPDKHLPELPSEAVELADVFIRMMNYAHRHNLPLATAIIAKMEYNKTRPYRHGGKAA